MSHYREFGVETTRGQRQGHALALRRLLFDVKTIHGGTAHYYSAHAAEERAGAVRHRERQVAQDYLSHARQLDREHHGAAGTAAGPPGPIEQRLMSFTTPRGLVFGQYGPTWKKEPVALTGVRAFVLATNHARAPYGR